MAVLDDKTQRKEAASSEQHHWTRLTRACNNNCIFCLDKQWHDGTARPVDEIMREIEQARTQGDTRLILSGGEATMHPDFIEIVRRSSALGFRRIQVVSNGRKFAYGKFLREAMDAGLGEITFSMHGHTPELHEAQTRVPGSFHQALAGLVNALRSGRLIVNIDIVISKFNYKIIDQIMDFYIGLGVREFDLLHVTPYGGAWDNRAQVYYDPAEAVPYLNKAFAYSRRPDLFVWTNRFPPEFLTEFPELIQNPLKIRDEVLGRRDLLDAFLESGRLICRGARCRWCWLRGFCDDLFRTRRALDMRRAPGVRIAAEQLARLSRIVDPDTVKTLIVHGGTARGVLRRARHVPPGARVILDLDDYAGAAALARRLAPARAAARAASAEAFEQIREAPGLAALLQLNAATAPYIRTNARALKKDWVRLFLENRMSLTQSREADKDLAAFFMDPDLRALRSENIPGCAVDTPPRRRPWFLDADALDARGQIDLQSVTESYIRNRYYVFPAECAACALRSRCPGLHVNHYRAFAFRVTPRKAKPRHG